MIDRIHFLLDRVEPTVDALSRSAMPAAWRRCRYDGDRSATDTVVFKLHVGSYAPIRVIGSLSKDHRPRFWKVEVVLPSLLYGHNGRPLSNSFELALALTRLQFLLRLLTVERGHARLVPGVGADNLSYINYVETSVQIRDPEHAILKASHMARMIHQRKPTAVYWGESSRMSTKEVHLSFYDKLAKIGKLGFIPTGGDVTRIEAVYKNSDRIATELAEALSLPCPSNLPPVATLAFEDSYRMLRHALRGVTGFGWVADAKSLRVIRHPKARLMAAMIGPSITEPHKLESALDAYRSAVQPSDKTFREVEKQLRAYAFNLLAPTARKMLPEDPTCLEILPVHSPPRETEWKTLERELKLPTEPDPAILEAWSSTRFLACKPHPGALSHPVLPSPSPFLGSGFQH